jgi:hypothetical protein
MDSGSTSIHKGTPNTEVSGSTISPMYRFFSNKKILERAPSSDILLLLNYPNFCGLLNVLYHIILLAEYSTILVVSSFG